MFRHAEHVRKNHLTKVIINLMHLIPHLFSLIGHLFCGATLLHRYDCSTEIHQRAVHTGVDARYPRSVTAMHVRLKSAVDQTRGILAAGGVKGGTFKEHIDDV